MPDKAEVTKAIAKVESEILELRISLGRQKEELIKQGKLAIWNKNRIAWTKPLYNLLERRWALSLVKYSSSEALYNVKVIGILLPEIIEGAIVPPERRLLSTDVMTKEGLKVPRRTYDVLQFEVGNPNLQPHELKSDAGKSKKGVLASSVEGGMTDPVIEVHLRRKSPPGKQIATEKELIFEASKIPGSKIVVEGTDAVTGKVLRMHADPQGLNIARFSNYTDLPDVLSLHKPDPSDIEPTDKPAKKKKARPAKGQKKTSVTPTQRKRKQAIPAGDLAKVAEDAAGTPKAKQAKPKIDPTLKANRGVTAPSPTAPTDVGEDSADRPPGKKQPIKRKIKTPVKAKTPMPSRGITPPSPHAPIIDEAAAANAQRVATRTLPPTPPNAPITAAPALEKATTPSVPKVDAHTAPGKSKFSLPVKISPKVKVIGGFVLMIGFDLFLGWLEGRRISKVIKTLLAQNTDKFTAVVNDVATQEDFVKFRFGSDMEKGYQLYFRIALTVIRRCPDGGCGTSGHITDISLKEVAFSRTKGSDFLPDPEKEKGWDNDIEGTAVFYQPIFPSGIPVKPGTEDAADEALTKFYETFVLRKGSIGDYARDYYDAFEQYYKYFPDSPAGKLFLRFGLTDELYDLTAVDLARKPAMIMMEPPHNFPFEKVIKQVRWGLASKLDFIIAFYELVIHLRPEWAIYYLERYDVYFRLLDSARKCDYGCHRMTGDKRIIHRLISDDFHTKLRAPLATSGEMVPRINTR